MTVEQRLERIEQLLLQLVADQPVAADGLPKVRRDSARRAEALAREARGRARREGWKQS